MIRIPQSRSAEPAQPTTRRTDDLTITPFTILYDRREREGGWRFGEIEQAGERKTRIAGRFGLHKIRKRVQNLQMQHFVGLVQCPREQAALGIKAFEEMG